MGAQELAKEECGKGIQEEDQHVEASEVRCGAFQLSLVCSG